VPAVQIAMSAALKESASHSKISKIFIDIYLSQP
jgi:hypothetical protein